MADRRQSGASSAKKPGPASTDGERSGPSSPEAQVRALYEQAETQNAKAFEEFVSKPSFGWMLARSAENVAALARIGADFADLVLRGFRVASRADTTRLARQLHRTEDKLEMVLQEVERLRDDLVERGDAGQSDGREPNSGEQAKADR